MESIVQGAAEVWPADLYNSVDGSTNVYLASTQQTFRKMRMSNLSQ